MIIHLPKNIDNRKLEFLQKKHQSLFYKDAEKIVMITGSKHKELEEEISDIVLAYYVMDSDIQLASRAYFQDTREIDIAENKIGGSSKNTIVMAGPCSVESEEQINESAAFLKSMNIKVLRAGSFKPRTSPYTFQGMGKEGLKLLAKMREEYGFTIISEVRDASSFEPVADYADIVQIGAKAMYDHGILRKCAKIRKPVLLKRGFGSTLQEFVQCAEFILSGGNEDVILCERGIRTFETKTRFTLDLCGVAYLKEHVNLPIVLDPSHAMGYSYGVADLARACVAMGIDGLLVETHPKPSSAKSDAAQQLDHVQFKEMYDSLGPVASAVGRKII